MTSKRRVITFFKRKCQVFFHLSTFGFWGAVCLLLPISPAKAQNIALHDVTYSTFQKDSLFSIRVPDYLVETNDLDAEAVLQLKNTFFECYITVIANEKSKTSQMNLQQMESHFKSNMLQRGGRFTQETHDKIDSFESFQKEIEWSVDGELFVFLVTFIDTPNVIFKVFSWTLAEHKQSLAHFRKAVESFRLTKPRS